MDDVYAPPDSPLDVVHVDDHLLVLNKPSGLPVLPAGGFLEHTLLKQLQAWAPEARPVHRLGRFTSGLLVCARRPATRAWLSAQLRDSTDAFSILFVNNNKIENTVISKAKQNIEDKLNLINVL